MSNEEQEVLDPLPVEDEEPETDPGKTVILASDVLPPILPLFPLYDRPLFPKMMTPTVVMDRDTKRIVVEALKTEPTYLGLVLVTTGADAPHVFPENPKDFHRVGVVGKITQVKPIEKDQPIQILMQLVERFEIEEILGEPPLYQAKVNYWHTSDSEMNAELKAFSITIIDCIKEVIQLKPLAQEELNLLISQLNINDPGTLADIAAFMTSGTGDDLQEILETKSVRTRLEKVLILLKKELEISKLTVQINKRIEDRLTSQQREFFLREQLKEIKKELGLSKEDNETEEEKLKKRLKKLTLTKEAKGRVKEEMSKLQLMDPSSPEFNVIRGYLDWLTILPWGRYSKDKFDLKRAIRILDRDHYGLKDVKERILEFISVGIVKGDLSGSIILFVGPPGVGKTSIGHSIAKSLGRKFYRFSVGGMRDEAEIKGHRRTYVGAMPGKFINAIKMCKTSNPVIMLDEIDKIGASFRGDPASALLEVLDPEQNQDFLDHYLDVRFDLSKVLFICTANQLDTIPLPLLDRMEVIRLSGYTTEDKVHIAKEHLIPKQLKKHGLKARQFAMAEPVVRRLIDGYAREAGVRGLENQITKILRKTTKKIVQKGLSRVKVLVKDLQPLLGQPVFQEEKLYKSPQVGVVLGLAYTSMGGATLFVEASKTAAKNPGLKQTGQLGDVMVESSEIAYTFIRSIFGEKPKLKTFFEEHVIHLHVPAGATPKDGPSAGITMACALYSLAKNIPLRENIAMTGELSLNGLVMPIGGVKEKLLAAKRANVSDVIFPIDNKMDFEELDDVVRKGIKAHFVRSFDDVRAICFE